MPAAIGRAELSRRGMLGRLLCAIGAAAIPIRGMASSATQVAADRSISPVMAKLSSYMSEARSRALPDDVAEKAKQHVLDTMAAMVSGSELAPGSAALRFARVYGGPKTATVVGSNTLCGPIEAAMVNGQLAHADETDDHIGSAVVPATMAAGEQFGIDGTTFLRGVVLGFDIATRVAIALGGDETFRDQGHKSTESFGQAFGAAAAAGCAARLNAQQMRWLLDYTAQQASGIAAWTRDTEHIEKAFACAGMPARSGVTAALVVHSGWTGVDDIFSGPDNFLLAYNPQGDPGALIEKLGERYDVTRTTIKKWSVGMPIQAPLDALEIVLKQHPCEPDDVGQVVVRLATSKAAVVDNRDMPDICIQHMVAVMLMDKTVSFRAAHDKARMHDPTVLRQRAKVKLVPDEALQRLLPKRAAIVEVTFTDGTHITERAEAVRGTAENPMTRDEVIAKACDLMAPVLGETTCKSFAEKVFVLEDMKDIRELRRLHKRD